ncbi:cupin domain-containing protein [Verrucomicrobiota bacterium]
MIRTSKDMRIENREDMRGGEGTVTIVHCFEKEEISANARLCSRLILPPGSSIGTHRHEAEDEVFIVMRGSGLIDDGESQARVSVGDAVLTGRGESHAVRNDGTEDLEMVAVIMCYGA